MTHQTHQTHQAHRAHQAHRLAIITCARDTHAKVVSFCLAQEGLAHLYLHTDTLTRNRFSFRVGSDAPARTAIQAGAQRFLDTECAAVWNRRHVYPGRAPGVPITEEARVIREESGAFSFGLAHAFCGNATWFNPPEGEARAGSKLAQLRAAQALGMRLPETLIGNDPDAIRQFVDGGTTVYKSFLPISFTEQGRKYSVATTRIVAADLPAPASLQALPGIFQKRVDKVSDLRLFIVGDQHAALEMPLSANPRGADDIRSSAPHGTRGSAVEAPAPLLRQCRELMGALGIRTASFDFVRDGQGAWYFLEVNAGGQFLWLETADPDTAVLAKFLNAVTASAAFDRYSFRAVVGSAAWKNYRVDPDGLF